MKQYPMTFEKFKKSMQTNIDSCFLFADLIPKGEQQELLVETIKKLQHVINGFEKEDFTPKKVTIEEMEEILKNTDHEGYLDIVRVSITREEVEQYILEYIANTEYYTLK